jgi:ribosomal protein S18 acetylase RimI-like enzyme
MNDRRMLQFGDCVGTDIDELCHALNDAYSTYPIHFNLGADQFRFLLRHRGFQRRTSAVACEKGGRIAAFWLTGENRDRDDVAYVIAVGVCGAWLRMGLARALFQLVAAALRDRGYRALRLEVLEANIQARSLYRSLGFRELRHLSCVRGDIVNLRSSNQWTPQAVGLDALDTLAHDADWRSTWQNEVRALLAIACDVDVRGVFDNGMCLGAGAFIVPNRTVAQILVAKPHRRRGIGTAIVEEWSRLYWATAISAINIDAGAVETITFMKGRGLAEYTRQVEMELTL